MWNKHYTRSGFLFLCTETKNINMSFFCMKYDFVLTLSFENFTFITKKIVLKIVQYTQNPSCM